MWGLSPHRWLLYPAGTASVLWLWGKPHSELPWFVKWKEAKAALATKAPERCRKSVTTGQPASPKAQQASPTAEKMSLGEGWNHVLRGGRIVKTTTTPPTNPHRNLPPQPVTEVPEQPIVTATREKARPQKPEPKSTAVPKGTAGKNKKAAASVKTAAAKPTLPNLVVPTENSTSLLQDISDLLDHLPLPACVELTRRLLASTSSLPKGAARPRAVLKTLILFVAE